MNILFTEQFTKLKCFDILQNSLHTLKVLTLVVEAAMNFLPMRGETGSLIFSFISDLYLLAICSGGEMLCYLLCTRTRLYLVAYVNRIVFRIVLELLEYSKMASRTHMCLLHF